MFVFPLLHPPFTPRTEGVEPRPGHDGSLWMRRAIQASEEKQMEKWKPSCFALCNHSLHSVKSGQDAQTEMFPLISLQSIYFLLFLCQYFLFYNVTFAHKDPGWH